ncbi:hypothetical protein ACFE04_015796 [Oxalis oulophora]
MAENKKIIAICQSGGEFTPTPDGSLSYIGGQAFAIDIDLQTTLDDFKSEVAETFTCTSDNMLIKYFLPGNKKTLITIAKDKDFKRMIHFVGDAPSADIFIMTEEAAARNVSNMPCSRSSRTTVSEAEVPVALTDDADPDHVDYMTNEIDMEMPGEVVTPLTSSYPGLESQRKAAQQWTNIITGVGQRFNSFNELRDALHKFSIARGFAYKYKKNDNHRISAKCKSEGCPWRLYASKLSTTQLICVKKMEPKHTCAGTTDFKAGFRATKGWVGNIIKEKLKVNPNYKPKDIVADIQREYGIELHYSQARRAKEVAREQLQGSHTEAYTQVPFFCEKIKETNPGSVATFATKDDSSFHGLFVSFHASINGLNKALAEVFDNSYHSYCVRHLAEKIIKDLKGQFSFEARRFLVNDFYAAANAPKPEDFQRSAENIKGICPDAYNWVVQSEPEHWANAFFPGARYNLMSANIGKEFYSWVSEANELPITQMIDALRVRMMEFIYTRRVESSQWLTKLTPSNEEKLQKEILAFHALQAVQSHQVLHLQDNLFEVSGETAETVHLDRWDCSCKGWQLTGLPCSHAIAVILYDSRDPYDFCAPYFTTESYRLTYAESIHPVPNVDKQLQGVSNEVAVVVTPPPTKRPPGRPKAKQAEALDLFKRQLQCSKCKGLGHNKKTCKEHNTQMIES